MGTERLELYKKTRAIAKVKGTRAACSETGMTLSSYYVANSEWKKKWVKAPVKTGIVRRKPTITKIPVAAYIPGNEQGGLLFALIGAPKNVMDAIKAYS